MFTPAAGMPADPRRVGKQPVSIMKFLSLIPVAALTIFALASCEKDVPEPEPPATDLPVPESAADVPATEEASSDPAADETE